MDVRECGGDNAGGKGGSVQFVVGVQYQRDVQGSRGSLRWLYAVQHPQKVSGVGERAVGRNDLKPFAHSVVDGDDHGDLRSQVIGLAHIGVVGVVFLVGVVEA